MKALKEKRISLRSLWRRGLVILSLFALVFASCGDSGSGSGGKIITSVAISGAPTTQYFGAQVDLTGTTALITYADKTTETVTFAKEPGRFAALPPLVTGEYDIATGAFTGMPNYSVAFDGVKVATPTAITVKEIRRGAGYVLDPLTTRPGELPDFGYYTGDLHVNSTAMKKKTAFVDDLTFDFSGAVVTAIYEDGAEKEILYKDLDYLIVPDYANKCADGTAYKGWVYVMVGSDKALTMGAASASKYRSGITAAVPLEKVFTVETIKVDHATDMEDFYFWMPNTPAEWTKRLIKAGYSLTVSYMGSSEVHKFTIEDLEKKQNIWYNADAGKAPTDFFVLPLSYPFTAKANPAPALKVYYRGTGGEGVWAGRSSTPVLIPVNVFTKLQSLDVRAKDGTDIAYSADDEGGGKRDNDILGALEGGSERDLCSKLLVEATYVAYNDPNATAKLELSVKETDGTGVWPAYSAGYSFPLMGGVHYGSYADGGTYITNYEVVRAGIKAGAVDSAKSLKIWYWVEVEEAEKRLTRSIPTAAAPTVLPTAGFEQKYTYDKNDKDFYINPAAVPVNPAGNPGNRLPLLFGPDYTTGVTKEPKANRSLSVKWSKSK